VGTTTGVSKLGDLTLMRRESRRCKLHHILGALAAHFSARATPTSL
jgi:hypothetical protein